MPTLIIPANVTTCQVEIPDVMPTDAKQPSRSVKRSLDRKGEPKKGALYVRPASTLTVSDDEWVCMQANYPALAKQLIVAKGGPSLADRIKQKEKALKGAESKAGASLPMASPPAEKRAEKSKEKSRS